jgi:trk system potassium uptake protein
VVARDGFLIDEYVDRVIIPHHDTVIESDDHVIVFCTRKKQVVEVERLFQVAFGFM